MNMKKARAVVLVLTLLVWLFAFGQVASAANPEVDVIVHIAVAPTVSSSPATGITSISAILHGSIDDDGNEPCGMRMFQWGLASGNYTYSWNETGSFTEGAFAHAIGSLPLGVQVFWMASANNTIGTGNSSERSFWTLTLPLAPTNFRATQTGPGSYNLTWTQGIGANWTIVRGSEDGYPTSITDGYLVYNGTGEYVGVSGLDVSSTSYYYSAWSENVHGISLSYARTRIQGAVSIAFIALMIIPLGLTAAMFATKNMMLGFPCGIFWGVLGGYAYLQSTSTWDWQYLLFFACIGMVMFSILVAYTLRRKDLAGPDADDGLTYIDEGTSPQRELAFGHSAYDEDDGW